MVAVTQDLIDITLADATTGFVGTSGQLDTEVFKEGSGAYTYQTGKNSLEACTFTPATNINMTANYTTPHLYWTMRCDVFPFCEALNTGATNSGLMVRVTDGSGNYTQWHVAGSDTWDGSWRTFVLDLTNTTDVHSSSGTLSLADVDVITFYTDNSNSGNIRIIDNTWLDAIRYGDGLQAESTTTETFDFGDIAADDALTANYYGVIQPFFGILAAQGGLIIGDATGSATTDFVSRNEQVVFQDQIVSSSHYGITAVSSATATTDFDITGLIVSTIGGTGAEIDFSDTDINSIIFTDSTFVNMGAITWQSLADVRRNVYVGCGQITAAGADMRGSSISGYEGTAGTAALVYNVNVDPDGEFDDMAFTKGTAATHAIEFGSTSPSSITLRGIDFSGYSGTTGNNDAALYISDSNTGNSYTINLVGCTGTIAYRSAGASVTLVTNPVTATVKAVNANTTANIQGAYAYLEVASSAGGYPYLASVSVSVSGTVATVTHTGHGLSSNDKVRIRGLDQPGYNGIKTITVTGANTYTYTVVNDGTATGSATSTFVVLAGLTDSNGEISGTYSYLTNQPVIGKARLNSGAGPYYVTANISATISSSNGLTYTASMVPD